jgi:hypothetical protein
MTYSDTRPRPGHWADLEKTIESDADSIVAVFDGNAWYEDASQLTVTSTGFKHVRFWQGGTPRGTNYGWTVLSLDKVKGWRTS